MAKPKSGKNSSSDTSFEKLKIHNTHPELWEVANKVMDIDKEYFEKHPLADYYYRKPIEGEFFSDNPERIITNQDDVIKVLVRNLGDGLRIRMPIFREE